MPAGSPHFVENLTHTIAVSGNYVDCSNLTLVLEELGNAQYADETSADLRRCKRGARSGEKYLVSNSQHLPASAAVV